MKRKKENPPPKKTWWWIYFSPQKAIFQKRFLTASSLIIHIDAQKCRPTLMNNVPHNMKQFKNVVCCTFFFCDYIVVCPLPMSLYCILHLPVLDYYLVSSYPPCHPPPCHLVWFGISWYQIRLASQPNLSYFSMGSFQI